MRLTSNPRNRELSGSGAALDFGAGPCRLHRRATAAGSVSRARYGDERARAGDTDDRSDGHRRCRDADTRSPGALHRQPGAARAVRASRRAHSKGLLPCRWRSLPVSRRCGPFTASGCATSTSRPCRTTSSRSIRRPMATGRSWRARNSRPATRRSRRLTTWGTAAWLRCRSSPATPGWPWRAAPAHTAAYLSCSTSTARRCTYRSTASPPAQASGPSRM